MRRLWARACRARSRRTAAATGLLWRRLFVPLYRRVPWPVKRAAMDTPAMTARAGRRRRARARRSPGGRRSRSATSDGQPRAADAGAAAALARDRAQGVRAWAAKVAAERAERGWSLAQLAQRAGISPAAVHKIEKNGMTPTIASLMKIAAALGRSVSYFVEEPRTPDVTVVRADERAQVYTSKQGLDLRNSPAATGRS